MSFSRNSTSSTISSASTTSTTSTSSASSTLERRSIRGMTISVIPSSDIHRESFPYSPNSGTSSATSSQRTSPTSPAQKRHGMLLGPLTAPPMLALPSIGEDHLVSWERRGSTTLAFWTPTETASGEDYFGAVEAARPAGPSPVSKSVRFSPRSTKKATKEVTWAL